jgi:hypothetical protein
MPSEKQGHIFILKITRLRDIGTLCCEIKKVGRHRRKR